MVKIDKVLLLLSIVLFFSCKISNPAQQPVVASLPATFKTTSPDTTISSGDIAWNKFFGDPFLIRLIEAALQNNPDMQMAIQRINIARANVSVAKGMLLPSLTAVAAAGQRKFGEYTMDGIGNYDTNFSNNVGEDKRIAEHLPDYYTGLQSSWEIDLWGKLRNHKRAAVAHFLASEKGKHLVTTSLVATVARFYYELLALDNELKFIRDNIALQQTAVNLIHAQKAAGRATELAVKQFTAQLLSTQSLEARVKQNIIQNENELNAVLGRFSQPVERGEPILQQILPDEIHEGIPSNMLVRRPDIQQAEFELIATKANVRAARAAFFPSLTLTSAIGYQAFNTSVLFNSPGSIAYSVFGGLAAPLFNRNMIRSDYKIASASQIEMFYQYHKTVLNGFAEVSSNLKRIENLEIISDLKQQEVEALQAGVAVSKDLFIAGLASYLEVITAQRSALDAELQLSETRKEQFHSLIDLYKSLGGGW